VNVDRLAIVAALEALEAGDLRLLEGILLGALEDDVHESWAPGSNATSTSTRSRASCECSTCGQTFEWPGLRDKHEQLAHGLEDAA
jgi:hypothetical protein